VHLHRRARSQRWQVRRSPLRRGNCRRKKHFPNKETGIVRKTVTFDAGYLFITELQSGHYGLRVERMYLKRSEQQKMSCPALLLALLHDRSSTT
jgi:hypothetical protein